MQRGFSTLPVLTIVVAIALGGFFLYKQQNKTNSQSPETSQSLTNSEENSSTRYKVAFHKGGDAFGGGDLWIMNSDGLNKKQITSTNTISTVHGWSPDNKLIAVTLEEPDGPDKVKWSLSVVDVNTGEVTKVYEPFISFADAYWLNNSLLVFPNEKQIETISVSDKKHEILLKTDPNNKDATHIRLAVSSDKKFISYYYSGNGEGDPPQVDTNTYSFDIDTKTNEAIFDRGHFLAWRGDKIVYQPLINDNTIWESNPDGSGKTQLMKVGDGDLIQLVSSSDAGKILYQMRDYKNQPASAKLFLYDVETKQLDEIRRSDYPDGIRDPDFSPDGEFVSYYILPTVFQYQLYAQKLSTNQELIICDDELANNCSDAKWSNRP